MQEQKQTANRNYKDSVFVDLFGEDKKANRHYCTRNRFDHTGNRENPFIIFPFDGLSTDPASNLFAAAVFFKRCFSALSTDTDVGGSKQKRVLLSKTCYQTCTRMYRFDNCFQKPHLHYTRGEKDFCFNRCPGDSLPYFCLFLTYGRNSFCEKASVF